MLPADFLRRGLDIGGRARGDGQADALPGQGGGAGLAEALARGANDRVPAGYAEIHPGASLVGDGPDRPAAPRIAIMRPAVR
jgi:hypothetical protein